ncbi:MAG: DMT family transporter [Pseudomonadota bacterium]
MALSDEREAGAALGGRDQSGGEGAGAPAPTGGDLLSWALLMALGLIWGGSFTLVGFAVDSLPPLTVAATRLIIGAAALIPLAFWLGDGLPWIGDAYGRAFWLSALGVAFAANAAPFALLSWALTITPSGLGGVFMATVPLIVLPLAARFTPGEPMTLRRTLGFLIGFAGVVALIGVDALGDLGGGGWEILAQLACLAVACGYAVGSILTKRAPPSHSLSFGAAAIGLAALMLIPPTLALEQPFAAPWSLESAVAVLFLGLLPTALAAVLLFIVVRRRGPGFLSLVNYLVPLWALGFGVALLGEAMPAQTPIALGLILAGVFIAQSKARPHASAR